MSGNRRPIDLSKLKVYPLAERRSLTTVEEVLIDPASSPPSVSEDVGRAIDHAAENVRDARRQGASVMLIYGAHLLRNGAALFVDRLLETGFLTHLATNGAGSIHDWEYAWLGRSTESVKDGTAEGRFGAWNETGKYLTLALLRGALDRLGYAASVGKLIIEDGVDLPDPDELEEAIVDDPCDELTGARAELLGVMREFKIHGGKIELLHSWKHASILASAFKRQVSASVHPGVGYDIIANHPMYRGAAIGRAGERDFAIFGGAVEGLDGGVVLSVGSAIMGPQVFEKSLSCVNNLRIQEGRKPVEGHSILVVDLQDNGGWDWRNGEPPKSNPAYYLRFCKSYSRMGGQMQYLQCDNMAFLHHLARRLILE